MNVLFVHQNFPGQFRTLAPALVKRGDTVVAMGISEFAGAPGIRFVRSTPRMGTGTDGHPWSRDFDSKVIRAEATLQSAIKLRDEGFRPDVIIAHPGWGESLFLKIVWPEARLGIYCEFYYSADGADMNFDPEFPGAPYDETAAKLLIKNAGNLLHFNMADAGISPTRWQADSFPEPFRRKIAVIHDGIDIERVKPVPGLALKLNDAITVGQDDEVITFVNRNLEPYRGYHVFMRALPELMRRRPNARVIIVGGNEVSYGAPPPAGQSWRDIFLKEVASQLDLSRVHFVGKIPYAQFLGLLAVSSVHVYLTYPFVLSWSLIEAMAMECAIVASDTEPVREAITDGEEGVLVPFFDRAALIDSICSLLDDPQRRAELGRRARERAVAEYDLRRVCLPRQIEWVDALYAAPSSSLA